MSVPWRTFLIAWQVGRVTQVSGSCRNVSKVGQDELRLSSAARSVWAKSGDDQSMSLARHLADTAAVAGHLWDTFLPEAVRSQIVAAVGDADLARRLAVWSAAGH